MIVRIAGKTLYVPIGHVMFFVRVREIERLRSYLNPIKKTDRLLDVGCGEGYWTAQVAAKAGTSIGMDIGIPVIRTAHRFNSRGCFFCVADTGSLPFGDSRFDRIMSVCVLEHIPHDVQALKEMRRVICDTGVLAVSVDSYSNPEIPVAFKQWQRRRFGVLHHYRIEEIQEKAHAAHFAVTDYSYICNNRLSLALGLLAIRARPLLFGVSPLMTELSRRLDTLHASSKWGIILAARLVPRSKGCIV